MSEPNATALPRIKAKRRRWPRPKFTRGDVFWIALGSTLLLWDLYYFAKGERPISHLLAAGVWGLLIGSRIARAYSDPATSRKYAILAIPLMLLQFALLAFGH